MNWRRWPLALESEAVWIVSLKMSDFASVCPVDCSVVGEESHVVGDALAVIRARWSDFVIWAATCVQAK